MIKPDNPNTEFQLGGINHVALVCADMAKTVDFYSGVLGMPLIKSLDLPGGMGQHFFFDAGNGDCVAFFWFTEAADRVPGISSPAAIPGIGEITSSVSSMNHLAFHVPAEKFDEYRQRLKDKGRPGRARAQPRREPCAGLGDCAPRRLCAVVLLPRPRRDHAGVRLLGEGIHRGRRADGAEDRSRPSPAGDRGPLSPVQLGVGQRVEDGGQLVDQLVGVECDIAVQPRAEGLRDACDGEMRDGLALLALLNPERGADVADRTTASAGRLPLCACERAPSWPTAS